MITLVIGLVVLVIGIYALTVVALYVSMLQTPERFGAIVAQVPGPAVSVLLRVVPFKSISGLAARRGLKIGDRAPDFTLPDLDGQRRVTLSDEYRQRPVVLVFGSYT
jgi:hypothetical protein